MIDKRTTRTCDYFGEKNPNSKLSTSEVLWIRQEYAKGAKPTALAKEFGVTQCNISNIVARRIWRHI